MTPTSLAKPAEVEANRDDVQLREGTGSRNMSSTGTGTRVKTDEDGEDGEFRQLVPFL